LIRRDAGFGGLLSGAVHVRDGKQGALRVLGSASFFAECGAPSSSTMMVMSMKTEMIQFIFCEARNWKPHLPRNAT
jgi:hypothetical protein